MSEGVTAALAIRIDVAVARVASAIAVGDALALLAASARLTEVAEEAGRVAAPDARLRGAVRSALALVDGAPEALAGQLAALAGADRHDRRLRAAYRDAT